LFKTLPNSGREDEPTLEVCQIRIWYYVCPLTSVTVGRSGMGRKRPAEYLA